MSQVFFDDAMPAFARIVLEELGDEALLRNLMLRDAAGLVTFIVVDSLEPEQIATLRQRAKALAPYVDSLPVATPGEMYDDELASPDIGIIEWIEHPDFSGFVRILERRVAGHDWLHPPAPPVPGVPPVIAFASHKGGVGRSTALCVTAAHLAATGRNVLVVDLDLEAPGLGAMLLPTDRTPPFGALDFYVENGLRTIGRDFLDAMIAVSPLTTGRGLVHVVPAIGHRSEENPQNVVGKLSRAYLEDIVPGQPPRTFLEQTRDLLRAAAAMGRYDAILVDARAGLNESTAAVLLGLGAWCLLFGIDTPQTFQGYRYLLAFLGRYRPSQGYSGPDWRGRLRMVHAKALADPCAWERFHDTAYDLFAETLYDEAAGEESEAFNFDRHADRAPHKAWPILNDSQYLEFNPLHRPEQLQNQLFARTFAALLDGVDAILKEAGDV